MTTPFVEITEAIVRLQHAMRRYRMEPAIIELSTWDEGMQLKSLLDRSHIVDIAMSEDGRPVNQVEIAGTIVRWPTRRRVLFPSGYDFE